MLSPVQYIILIKAAEACEHEFKCRFKDQISKVSLGKFALSLTCFESILGVLGAQQVVHRRRLATRPRTH